MFSCSSDCDRARKHWYKYEDGYHIGDWVEFDGMVFELSHDTIYKYDSAVAIIIEIQKNVFADDRLIVRDINSNETGSYFEKNKIQ